MECTVAKRERLDVFLTRALPGAYSRHRVKKGIEEGVVMVNGSLVVKSAHRVKPGDVVHVDEAKFPPLLKELRAAPDPSVLIDIVYEDRDVLVVNKPAGLLTHPTPAHMTGTLVSGLLARSPALEGVGEHPLRPGIVHRLDKNTSGLLVVAKTNKAFQFMKHQFMNRAIKKTYLALVEGVPSKKEGIITYAIRPSATNRAKRVVVRSPASPSPFRKKSWAKSVRAAETAYRVRETYGHYALLEVMPKTGRTHQVRVHLAALGHPVVGDMLYGSKTEAPRQLLHAARVEFMKPDGRPLSLEIPLPDDFKSFLLKLK